MAVSASLAPTSTDSMASAAAPAGTNSAIASPSATPVSAPIPSCGDSKGSQPQPQLQTPPRGTANNGSASRPAAAAPNAPARLGSGGNGGHRFGGTLPHPSWFRRESKDSDTDSDREVELDDSDDEFGYLISSLVFRAHDRSLHLAALSHRDSATWRSLPRPSLRLPACPLLRRLPDPAWTSSRSARQQRPLRLLLEQAAQPAQAVLATASPTAVAAMSRMTTSPSHRAPCTSSSRAHHPPSISA